MRDEFPSTHRRGQRLVRVEPGGGPKVPIARIVTDLDDTSACAEHVLLEVFRAWPDNQSARFTIAPGGFVDVDVNAKWDGAHGWSSAPGDLLDLEAAALPHAMAAVTQRVLNAARGKTDYLTLGVDLSFKNERTAELVAVFDVALGKAVHWTGKSYPTGGQQNSLIHVRDLSTHLFQTPTGGGVGVFGCHDLNAFHPRGGAARNVGGSYDLRARAIAKCVAGWQPPVLLHHPHRTDSPRIWNLPWATLSGLLGGTTWASAICYCYRDKKGRLLKQRRSLESVLAATRSQPTLDFLVDVRSFQ